MGHSTCPGNSYIVLYTVVQNILVVKLQSSSDKRSLDFILLQKKLKKEEERIKTQQKCVLLNSTTRHLFVS